MEDVTIFEISGNELEDLIYALNSIRHRVRSEDRLKITIDFNSGKVTTFVEPSGNYDFEIKL